MLWKKARRIVELENRIKILESDLIHDSLTGLKTRSFFESEVSKYLSIIAHSVESNRKELFGFKNLSILFLDIDHFKNVNDKYGHQVGDEAINIISGTIANAVREGDIVARWGGEEFIVLLLGAREVDARNKAEEIRMNISKLTFPPVDDLRLTISIGVTQAEKGITYDKLLEHADKALYNAKETGRNKVVTYTEHLKAVEELG